MGLLLLTICGLATVFSQTLPVKWEEKQMAEPVQRLTGRRWRRGRGHFCIRGQRFP